MPRLTSRVFTDLAIWMTGFGVAIGLIFPPFCLVLGLPAAQVLTPIFFLATLAAGVMVGFVNYGLSRVVVGTRLRLLAERMDTVESRLAVATFTHDWSDCDPETCALPVDSTDEVGAAAASFNGLIRTVARSHDVEQAVRSFSRVIQSRYDLEDLGEAALDELLSATGTEAGVLFVVREAALEPLATHGLRESEALSDNDHVRRALKTDTTVRLSVADPSFVVDSLLVGQPAREVLVGPISFKGVPLGVVVLATATGLKADAEHLLEGFRADLGLAVNNALAHDRLERLAAVDPLTDAYNRRFGLARLREEYSRAVRAESPLGVLMLDIDHFKAVNDTYGHLVGDRVLRAVAAACRRVVREGDVLIRYGGEEFMALLPGAGPADVREVGERIRRAVGETTIVEGDQQITVTVSLGGTIYRDATTESPDGLVAAADAALYEAKAAGRDRLVLA